MERTLSRPFRRNLCVIIRTCQEACGCGTCKSNTSKGESNLTAVEKVRSPHRRNTLVGRAGKKSRNDSLSDSQQTLLTLSSRLEKRTHKLERKARLPSNGRLGYLCSLLDLGDYCNSKLASNAREASGKKYGLNPEPGIVLLWKMCPPVLSSFQS